MGAPIPKMFVLMLGGTSLTAGRLTNPPIPWTKYLLEDMRASSFCLGPVRIINTGKGSQTSDFGASQAALMAPLRPSHVLMEDFAINDCAIGPVSIPQATANFNSMVASYRAANPDVIIVHQTMSPASAGDIFRTNLGAYYTNGLANAALNGLLSLDNYGGTVLVPGGWPKPLDPAITVGYAALVSTPAGFTNLFGSALNPADTDAAITLSNSNLTGTRTAAPGATYVCARSVLGTGSGKYYFEATPTAAGAAVSVGISQAATALNGYLGQSPLAWGYYKDGSVLNNGAAPIAAYSTYVTGDVIGVAFDLTNNRLWFRKNGGIWNGSAPNNPTTNVGGLAITPGTYYPTICIANQNDLWTAAFGDAGDGLHPVWTNAFQNYSYPNILAWAKQAMAAYWS